MSGLFSKPKVPRIAPPPPLAPPPPPIAMPKLEDAEDAAERAARLSARRSGFSKTLVTGELAPAVGGKKRLLGG